MGTKNNNIIFHGHLNKSTTTAHLSIIQFNGEQVNSKL